MIFLLFFFIHFSYAYTPTSESLFKHASNAEVLTNSSLIKIKVTKKEEENQEEPLFYHLIFLKKEDSLKYVQARYKDAGFKLKDLNEKIYHPNLSSLYLQSNAENAERGIFVTLFDSILFNSGKEVITFLKSLEVPLKLNEEVINQEKIELLSRYKDYLIKIEKDKKLKKTEPHPLKPTDPVEKEQVKAILQSPMYMNLEQVKIGKYENELAWVIRAGPLEVIFSYEKRDLLKLKYQSGLGEFEIKCSHYYVAAGVNRYPSQMTVKTQNGDVFDLEILKIKNINENEPTFFSKLAKMDEVLTRNKSLRHEIMNATQEVIKNPPFLFPSQH